MEILSDAVDYGDAPSFLATGIRRIFLVSPHIVRITFVRIDRSYEGEEVRRVSGHVDWDINQLRAANALIHEALMELAAQAPVMRPEYTPGGAAMH